MLKQVIFDPAEPVSYGRNKPGMQAGRNYRGWKEKVVRHLWLGARFPVAFIAMILFMIGVHKQVVNRLLEPWSYITVVMTSCYWENFWHLRRHPDADPTMRHLANVMYDAQKDAVIHTLQEGEWHTPYAEDGDVEQRLTQSAARCARTSYGRNGVKSAYGSDLSLVERLTDGDAVHASPFEHQLQACHGERPEGFHMYPGWVQQRVLIPNHAKMEKTA